MELGVERDLNSIDTADQNIAIIGYGSIIHPDEIEAEFGDLDPVSFPFKLKEYKRVFNNRSANRSPEGKESAVLNVVPDPGSWCNVVLIVLRDATRPEGYEEREKGYHFEQVSSNRLQSYISSDQHVLDKLDRIDLPIGDRVESDIEPISPEDDDYIDLCLDGAKEWARNYTIDGAADFYNHFIETTELADGTPLREYLIRESIEINR